VYAKKAQIADDLCSPFFVRRTKNGVILRPQMVAYQCEMVSEEPTGVFVYRVTALFGSDAAHLMESDLVCRAYCCKFFGCINSTPLNLESRLT